MSMQWACYWCKEKVTSSIHFETCQEKLKAEEDWHEEIRRRTIIFGACKGISTHALEYGIIPQMIDGIRESLVFLSAPSETARQRELLISRLKLLLAKVTDGEPV